MKRYDAAMILAVAAHVLALAAAIFLAFGPVYRGESVAAVALGEVAAEPVRTTKTLIEVNGLRVLPLILAPVLLTAVAALAATVIRADSIWRGSIVLTSAVLLLGLCVVGLFTIGLFFLPASVALAVAGVMGLRRRRYPYCPS